MLFALLLAFCSGMARAQLAGRGTIQGIVSDSSGAVLPNALITITNVQTGVVSTQTSTGSGFYSVGGFQPGTYNITISAAGFQTFTQEHVVLDALQTLGVNAKLNVGASDTVTVSDTLPPINTTDATLGSTMETDTFRALPLNMSGAPRDPTSFLTFTPGVKSDGRYGSFNGGQIDHDETYVEGIAITSINVQGDNSSVSRGFSVDAVDQFQAQTNGLSAAYDGQGIQNYTHKSGTNTYHGSAFEYFRNTVLDTWGFFSKTPNLATGQTVKPVERQNEFGGTVGGFVVKDKIFFFGSYDGMRFLKGPNPALVTIPTMEERNGDFSALLLLKDSKGNPTPITIYDPTSTVCTGGSCVRQAYKGNIIPAGQISAQTKYLQQFLPVIPLGSPVTNNYLAGFATGFNYKKISTKVDFDLFPKHRLSFLYTYGDRAANPACCDQSGLPQPYTPGVGNSQFYYLGIMEDNWTVNDHTINQLKYAVNFTGGPSTNPGEGNPAWAATAAGITGLPPGQASDALPRTDFAGLDAPTNWGTTNAGGYNNTGWYLLDTLQLVKGRHSLAIGGQYQWLDQNDTTIATGTYYYQNFGQNETSTFTKKGGVPTSTIDTTTGYSYASYLAGAVDSAGINDNRSVLVLGARFFTFAPFVQDDIRVSQRLTLNVGLRWDLNSPYREVQNRMSFLNINLPNPVATGAMGALQFAGSGNSYNCNCRTPVAIWLKNFAPRLGFAYAVDPKTVIRGSYGIDYTRAGGIGGRGGAQTGTGQLGFTGGGSYATSDGGITPAFYLQNGIAPYSLPSLNPAFGTGYTNTPGYTGTPNGVTYADPYLSRRAPYFNNFSLGFQRELLKQTTLSVDYSGSTGHFLGTGIGRGIYSNQLDPAYYVLGSLLTQPAAKVMAQAQAILPGLKPSFTNYNSSVSLGQVLRPFGEYNSFSDIWGDVGNSNYNSLQFSIVQQQPQYGLTYSFAYTFSKSLSDVNGAPTAYGNNAQRAYGIDPADTPHNIQAYVVYEEPFGRDGGFWLSNRIIRGWSTSATFHFTSGTPLAIITTGCTAPFSGTCLPNLVPGAGPVRINGAFHPRTLADVATTPYISSAAFATPAPFTFGNAPLAAPFGLRNPSSYDIDMALRRSFDVYEPWHLKFTFEASAFNLDNHTQFGGLSVSAASSTFGRVTSQSNGSRDIQLAARFDF